SPDLNPIEHLWDVLWRRTMIRRPTTREALIRILPQEWLAIPQETTRSLIRRMCGRKQVLF
ncbi:hypothetical protein CAPTEDRAFT_68550, partial [Capitella teleta]